MSAPTVNVTITVVDQTGAAVAGAAVTAQLTGLDLYNAQYVFPNVQSFTTDAGGLATMPLFPNALGQKNTAYQIKATHPTTGKTLVNVTVIIPNAACDVSALAGNNPASQPYPLPSVQPYSGNLTAIASLGTSADKITYWTGSAQAALTSFTATGRSLVGAASIAAASALLTGPFLAAGGSVGAPSYSFSGDATTGLFRSSGGTIEYSSAGTSQVLFGGGIALRSTAVLNWSSGVPSAAADLSIARDAANILAQRNGVNAQTLRIYNTFTDAANNEYGALAWGASTLFIGTFKNGTGSTRDIRFTTGGTDRWQIQASSGSLLAPTDNTVDIGASGATRPRSIYWGTQALGPNGTAVNPSYSFAGATNAGMRWNGVSAIVFSVASADRFAIDAAHTYIVSGDLSLDSGGGTILVSDANDVVAQRRGVNAQTKRVYNTFTDAANYERANLEWSSGVFSIYTSQAGTGTGRALALGTNSTQGVNFFTNGSTNIQLKVTHIASAVNWVEITGSATGGSTTISAAGGDATVGMLYGSKGAGLHSFFTNGVGSEQFRITNTTGATRFVTVTGSNGGAPTIGTSAGTLNVNTNLALPTSAVTVQSGAGIPAGGAANFGYFASNTAAFGIYFGSGAPTVSAAQGSLYVRSDGSSTSTRLYVNTNGTTGWTNVTTAT